MRRGVARKLNYNWIICKSPLRMLTNQSLPRTCRRCLPTRNSIAESDYSDPTLTARALCVWPVRDLYWPLRILCVMLCYLSYGLELCGLSMTWITDTGQLVTRSTRHKPFFFRVQLTVTSWPWFYNRLTILVKQIICMISLLL